MVAVAPAANVAVLLATWKLVTVTAPSTLVVPVRTLLVSGVSSAVVTDSLASVNASSTGVTAIVSVDVSVLEPSLVMYVATGTGPLWLATGVKVYAPPAAIVKVPTPAIVAVEPAANVAVLLATWKLDTVTAPSTLVVPVRTLLVSGVSSFVVTDSSASVNASSTGVIAMVSVDVSVLEPSLVMYVATGTGPL